MGLIADSVTIIYRYYKGFFFHMNKFHTSDLRDKISFFEIFKKWKFVFIGNLDIFPLISPCDIVSINRLLWYWKCYVKYIIMLLIKTIPSVSQISSYIITSITAHPISLTAILFIMSISTFKSAVTLYFYTESCILKSFILTNYSCDV